jgi:L,D-transpeptidase YcbB
MPGFGTQRAFAILIGVWLVAYPHEARVLVAPSAPSDQEDARRALEAAIAVADPAFGRLTASEQVAVKTLYGAAPTLLWLDTQGHQTPDAHDAMGLLAGASTEGLDPEDYHASLLERAVRRLESQPEPSWADRARVDVQTSVSVLRYFRHLHLGRVDPRAMGFRLVVPVEGHDFPALLRTALLDHNVGVTAAALRPPLPQYASLRIMLARYRQLAADASLDLPAPSGLVIKPGAKYPDIDLLVRRLVAFGDLSDEATASVPFYEGAVVAGVKRFQVRHGLAADGNIGPATWAALRVPLTWRVRQIEFALERLRWLPDFTGERLVLINIPMFRLWGWDGGPPNGAPSIAMGVITGRALSTQTPIFAETMREVIFRPYWNVPDSILRHEILPKLAKNPSYLRDQNMDMLREGGSMRVRQRPGPQNALGLVKFVFPNQENVYMHGTPAQELFARSRRDFSHGCVRLEQPVMLAEWVLADRPEWDREHIISAMNGTSSVSVPLTHPIQVVLFYTTAAVLPDDGWLHFAEDIYRHDRRLDEALSRVD